MEPVEGNIHHLRENYESGTLDINNMYPSPLLQFASWFEEAGKAGISEPNAMVLSTVSLEGKPSSRVVLLKEFNGKGFIFFTNYLSKKGQELSQNPNACLNFWWGPLERQIRISGVITKISEKECDDYFYSRPIGSQAGAVISQQSSEIESREWLEQKFIEIQLKGEIKRPDHWGGYILIPETLEFWQGRSNRLHDRLVYDKTENGNWKIKRLAP
ncbi:MAG: pyridoxamine 5'-phosphate oxidase [Chitinophagales bacterium]|nr:pyridoxamine 5'-phosphate oxidase [Chitinophagales bacterium]